MKLTLGFSTCPNDTFIFDAMVHRKIDTEGIEFDYRLADVEQLNQLAFLGEIDITKLSYHAFAYVSANYQLLESGSALGYNNGPLLISKIKIYPDELKDASIAIPGKYTTANMLMDIAFPEAVRKNEYLFSDIEEAILSREVDAGVIIHENRFTYEKKGLKKITDLGEFWETKTHLPIPLGGIVVKRTLDEDIKQKINRIMKRSVEFAMKNPENSLAFVKKYAQEMKQEIMYKHINLYVNNYTVSIENRGKEAITELFRMANEFGKIPKMTSPFFV